ncbi:hypothetical protein LEP1GSC163_3075 [Leptospira santarosai str. CBC379]|nr:hypothetical protein LEP1GSC163_3075 [Leptospira santarosai str. CBC379]
MLISQNDDFIQRFDFKIVVFGFYIDPHKPREDPISEKSFFCIEFRL